MTKIDKVVQEQTEILEDFLCSYDEDISDATLEEYLEGEEDESDGYNY